MPTTGIDIMGLAEVRWLQSGKIYADLLRSQERSQTCRRFVTQQSGLEVSVRVLRSV